MNAARPIALVFAVSLTLSALSGAMSTVAAQATSDLPSGCGVTFGLPEPEGGPAVVLTPTQHFARLLSEGRVALGPALAAWLSAPQHARISSNGSARVAGERRSAMGPASRQRALPVGR
jgi:hypothetical protein